MPQMIFQNLLCHVLLAALDSLAFAEKLEFRTRPIFSMGHPIARAEKVDSSEAKATGQDRFYVAR